jgi:hypothetical protein
VAVEQLTGPSLQLIIRFLCVISVHCTKTTGKHRKPREILGIHGKRHPAIFRLNSMMPNHLHPPCAPDS